jgi:hypothetical protein
LIVAIFVNALEGDGEFGGRFVTGLPENLWVSVNINIAAVVRWQETQTLQRALPTRHNFVPR